MEVVKLVSEYSFNMRMLSVYFLPSLNGHYVQSSGRVSFVSMNCFPKAIWILQSD